MENVQIRHVEFSDYPALQQLFAHPQVYRDTLQLPLPSLEMWAKKIKEIPAGMHNLVACIDEEIVGQLTVEANQRARRRHVATFGIAVDVNSCRKGVGSALMAAMIDLCDNWLNIQRIELTVFVDNLAAIALYRKFGFEIEGTSPRYAFRDGQFVDAHHMGRVKIPV
ncbi:TPA: GNAT family N-acetyltransferase [Yersinia enterocolitica]|uniref:GNAT family N-acetyltransferase n=1 Tax=Yersinia enterocolitica TaxID=630 RepID=UPI0003064940|nr:GNAT family N-acetyltransferase [Yersinia enterocolitica]EKN3488304.1 GNAT family N-acetyltransferase [Yersinia enterocolitica]EKN3561088.1 GNAT family N-acetyltransferase [Yersinia enterocolitica]EKN3731755.1 GNAT family N-acetyltransferase [Yersinia enterocolitica]EKN3880963.1 GNAT family N-acetyltransferase [Yersinia enterocolitica]EKN4788736.1 GNAT family N-acetyltransferase [Yersinia enterocolitica]